MSDPTPRYDADVPGGCTIDVFAEWGKTTDRVKALETAARHVVEMQDAHLMPNGAISCLRFVNTDALKALMLALGSGGSRHPFETIEQLATSVMCGRNLGHDMQLAQAVLLRGVELKRLREELRSANQEIQRLTRPENPA